MKTKIEMKQRLKDLGAEIRQTRLTLKNAQRTGNGTAKLMYELEINRSAYRMIHIAYSLTRGKKYSEIERKTRDGNEPNWDSINRIIEDLGRGE